MRGINHHEDWSWSNAPRKGSNTSTTTQQNSPPPQFLNAYSDVMQQATGVANQPLQQYPGTPQSLVAGFSPDQLAAFQNIEGAQGIADPYINSAAQFMQQAGQPLQTQDFTNYLTQAAGPQVTNAAQAGAAGITNAAQAGQAGVGAAGQAATGNILGAGQQGTANILGAGQQGTGNILGAGQLGTAGILGAGMQGVGGITAAGQQGVGNILGASGSYQPGQISQWMSPYTQQVVDATQAQFNNQNQQAQSQLRGNAASQGALGGDRLGVAQGILANQQQLAQAPTIANLYQQGFTQAEQQALQQAQLETQGATAAGQLGLGAATGAGQLGLGAAQGAGQLGLGAATGAGQLGLGAAQGAGQLGLGAAQGAGQLGVGAAGTQAQLGLAGAQGAGAMGLQGATTEAQLQSGAAQQILGANEAQGWLNSQLGYGMANLGQEAQSTNLAGANALLGIGGMQQQLGQEYLNIPYEQFVAQQSYPFQTTGWLANIAEGLGSQAGGMGTGTATSPGPSPVSQIAGLGLAGAGIYGLGNQQGWWGSTPTPAATAPVGTMTDQGVVAGPDEFQPTRRGGRIVPRFADGGGIDTSIPTTPGIGSIGMGSDPTAGMRNAGMPAGMTIAPDVSLSVVPQGTSPHAGTMDILKNYGSTSTSKSTGGDSIFGTIVKTAADVVASIYGGPAGGVAASAIGSQIHFDRGGRTPRRFATGGTPAGPPTVTMQPASYAGGVSVPQLSRTAATTTGSSGGTSSGGGVQSYLDSVLGQIPTAAQLAATKPQPAPAPSATPPPSFSGNASLSPQQQAWAATLPFSDALATLGGVPTMSQTFAGQPLPTFGGGMGGGGGGEGGGPLGNDLSSGNAAVDAANDTAVAAAEHAAAAEKGGGETSWRRGGALGRGFDDGGNVGLPLPDESTAGRAPPLGGSVSLPDPSFNSTVDAINASLNAPTMAPRATMSERRILPSHGLPTPPAPSSSDGTTPSQPPARSTPGFQDAIKALDDLQAPGHTVSPWMYLLQAGLGTMAGKSPFAGVNIGAGALGAVKSWESEDKDARDLGARVAEAKARIAESGAYQQSMIDTRNRGVDVQAQKAQDAINLALIKAADRAGRGGGSDRETVVPGMLSDQNTILVVGRDGTIHDTGVKAGPSANTSANISDREAGRQQQLVIAQQKADMGLRKGDSAEFGRNLRAIYNIPGNDSLPIEEARQRAAQWSAPAPAVNAPPPLHTITPDQVIIQNGHRYQRNPDGSVVSAD